MGTPTDNFIRKLTRDHRVIVLGGLAVIGHGFSRSTFDSDIWLEPMEDAGTWSAVVAQTALEMGVTITRLPGWKPVSGNALVGAVEETGMVRISGLDLPLDIFRAPNEIELSEFEGMFSRATIKADGTYLPEPLDLIQSKLNTGRDKDQKDIDFLEGVIRADYKLRLPSATFEEADALLARYSEWDVLRAALENPDERVRELAMTHLREFAAAGDPFSLAILEGREVP